MKLEERIFQALGKHSRTLITVEAIVLVILIGLVDYVTGYEVTIFPFYSIPILLAVWFAGRWPSILICVISALAWRWADIASGHVYAEWLRTWDTLVRLMFFCLVVIAGEAFRWQRDTNRAKIELLERLHKLEKEIITVSEREQQRIGRDLHDDLGQRLVAIAMAADSLKDDLKKESVRGASALEELAGLLHDTVTRTRDLSRGISPVDRNEEGLESALEQLTLSTSRLSGIHCSFVCVSDVRVYDTEKAVHLFRIAQEAVNNAVKHAKARNIIVAVEGHEGGLSLRISDDGIGLPAASPEKNGTGGMGLDIMQYRARTLGGTLEISPNTPRGTVVACTVNGSSMDRPVSEIAPGYE